MKKKTLITVLLLLIFSTVQNPNNLFAQNSYIGLQGGLSIPSLKGGNSEQSKGYKSRLGPDLGIFYDMSFANHFGLRVAAAYVGQGGIKEGIQPIPEGSLSGSGLPVPEGTILYANFKNEAILNYIEVPVLAQYSFDIKKLFKLYIDLGPYIGFLVEAKTKSTGSSQLFVDNAGTIPLTIMGQPLPPVDFNTTTDIKKDINTINLGISGGIGISKTLGPGELILDARGSYGLTYIQKDSKNGNNHTGCLVISLGYALKI
jgi:hypothetical protein